MFLKNLIAQASQTVGDSQLYLYPDDEDDEKVKMKLYEKYLNN